MSITIKDVAKKAGVSISTVSRVFNNSAFVDEEKSKIVHQAAKDLRYKPNQIARKLINSKTSSIGVILPGLYGEYYSQLIKGMDNIASRNNYDFLISNISRVNSSIEKNIRAMIGLVDGFIVMSPGITDEEIEEHIPLEIPVIFFNSFEGHTNLDSINVDNYSGAKAIVNHLIEHGHKKIAIIKGTEKSFDAVQRLGGYRSALIESNRSDYFLEVEGSFSIASGYEAISKILNYKEKPTAIFASNDAMAVGAISALKESHLDVPNDIAVVGFDDIPMAQYSNPRLTTVRTDLQKIGTQLMENILDAVINGGLHIKEHKVLPYDLVIRESCGTH